MPHCWNVCFSSWRLIGLFMTLTFDIWPCKPFSAVATHMLIFVEFLLKIPPLSTELFHHEKWVLMDGWSGGRLKNSSSVTSGSRSRNLLKDSLALRDGEFFQNLTRISRKTDRIYMKISLNIAINNISLKTTVLAYISAAESVGVS